MIRVFSARRRWAEGPAKALGCKAGDDAGDPRVWLQLDEASMPARLVGAFEDLNSLGKFELSGG